MSDSEGGVRGAVRDRVRGVLLGLAAGDRNGGPVRMALRLARSLLARGAFDPEDVLRQYLAWWEEDGIDSGPTTARVLEKMNHGTPPALAVAQVHAECAGSTAGCNPAHRSPPLAMAAFLAEDGLAEAAAHEAALTHGHPLAGDVAAAVVVLCRVLIRGASWPPALEHAAAGRCEETAQALHNGSAGPGGRGGYAPEVLRAAVYFVGAATEFEGALGRALDFAGPANYCPVLVGAIAGARWGAGAIGADSLRHGRLQGLGEELQATATSLAGAWRPGLGLASDVAARGEGTAMSAKTHRSALAVVPPGEVWGPIQEIRRRHDRQIHRWMPHLNVLYPFHPQAGFPAVVPKLAAACAAVEPFTVTLAEFRFFRHGSGRCTLWLAPEPAAVLCRLQAALQAACPDCDEVARFPAGFTPHLSVGQFVSAGDCERVREQLQANWEPLTFVLTEVALLARETSPFAVEQRVPLGNPVRGG